MFRSNRIDAELLSAYADQSGRTLANLAEKNVVFLTFLRHFGCTFCREMVAEIVEKRETIESRGVRLAFVHLSTEDKAVRFFAPYGRLEVPRFSDPSAQLYEAFGLVRAEWNQYLNRESLVRMVQAWIAGHGVGKAAGDVQRMPGVFLLQGNNIRKAYRHKLVSDRPDYLSLALVE